MSLSSGDRKLCFESSGLASQIHLVLAMPQLSHFMSQLGNTYKIRIDFLAIFAIGKKLKLTKPYLS